jgi:plasmid stability protein
LEFTGLRKRAKPAVAGRVQNEGLARSLTDMGTGTIMAPLWLKHRTMPTTLTLKNIPDEVYERLKLSAEAHRRSMNSEAIVCLETALLGSRLAPAERLARARTLRAALPKGKFRAKDIDAMKREGRS